MPPEGTIKECFLPDGCQCCDAAGARRRAGRGREPAQLLDPEDQKNIDLILMKRSLRAGRRYGKWFEHPNPNMGEAHKAMSWITPDNALDQDTVARMFLDCRLSRVENVFMLARRLFNAFEKPIRTPSGQNAVWHGYQPYNPVMVQKYLTIFRAVNNFIQVGEGGKTAGDAARPRGKADDLP